jgi:hypothetical protein
LNKPHLKYRPRSEIDFPLKTPVKKVKTFPNVQKNASVLQGWGLMWEEDEVEWLNPFSNVYCSANLIYYKNLVYTSIKYIFAYFYASCIHMHIHLYKVYKSNKPLNFTKEKRLYVANTSNLTLFLNLFKIYQLNLGIFYM